MNILIAEDDRTSHLMLKAVLYCHKIRNDAESWERLGKHISEHSDAEFSHGICPDCVEEHFPKCAQEKRT